MVTIELEPELQKVAGGMTEGECREMARQFYRWSKQLYRKADILASYPPEHETPTNFSPGRAIRSIGR
jgi:hypothetical protein